MISDLIHLFKNHRFMTTLLAGFFFHTVLGVRLPDARWLVYRFFFCVGPDGSAVVLIFPLHSGTPLPRIHLHILNFCMVYSSISDCRGFQSMPYDNSNFETTLIHCRLHLEPVIGRCSCPDIPTSATFSVFPLRRLLSPTTLPTLHSLDADSTSPIFLHCPFVMPRCISMASTCYDAVPAFQFVIPLV